MRARLAEFAVLTLPLGFAQAAFAQGGALGIDLAAGAPRQVLACTVTVLDTVSANFVCQTNRAAHRFWVARSTHFLTRGPNTSFFHLKTGQPVQVTFHSAGRLAIADVVRFNS